MSWKEFFKPTIWKIILALILIILNFLLYYNHITSYQVFSELKIDCPSYYDCYACGGSFLNTIGYVTDFPWVIYSLFKDRYVRRGICTPYRSYFYSWQVIFQIVYFYLLSCLIIYIYKKIKSKNKGKNEHNKK